MDSIEAYTIHLLEATQTSEDIGMYMTMEVMQMLAPTFNAEKFHEEAFRLFERDINDIPASAKDVDDSVMMKRFEDLILILFKQHQVQ